MAAFIVEIVASHSHTFGRPSLAAVIASWTVAAASSVAMQIDIIGTMPIRSTALDEIHSAKPITAPLTPKNRANWSDRPNTFSMIGCELPRNEKNAPNRIVSISV